MRILHDKHVRALWRLVDGLDGMPGRPSAQSSGRRTGFLTFRTGTRFFARLQDPREILGVPPQPIQIASHARTILGLMLHRDAVLPLLSFRRLAGLPDIETTPEAP